MARLLSILLLLSVCGCNFNNSADNFSSPKSLFVNHISSHTGGVISAGSDIRLQLTKGVSDSLESTTLGQIFHFSPDIKGSTRWEDQRTLVFTPAAPLTNGQQYEAWVDMEAIIQDIDQDKRQFKFTFQTLTQNFELNLDGLKLYDNQDLTNLKLEGRLQTADLVEVEQLKKTIAASQSGNPLNISWGEVRADHSVHFTVDNVKRKEQADVVRLKIDGAPIQVNKEEKHDVDIPALGDYKVVSSRIVQGDENYISVLFSDPLDPRQNLTGLVNLSNTNNRHRMVVDLNELKIYPTQELSSETELRVNTTIKIQQATS